MTSTHRTLHGPAGGLVSSVRIETDDGPHARVVVWNRHANAGTLVVEARDADRIASRLLGVEAEVEAEEQASEGGD